MARRETPTRIVPRPEAVALAAKAPKPTPEQIFKLRLILGDYLPPRTAERKTA
jgi:hypothetical protein